MDSDVETGFILYSLVLFASKEAKPTAAVPLRAWFRHLSAGGFSPVTSKYHRCYAVTAAAAAAAVVGGPQF